MESNSVYGYRKVTDVLRGINRLHRLMRSVGIIRNRLCRAQVQTRRCSFARGLIIFTCAVLKGHKASRTAQLISSRKP